jgi:hypothetical protein
MAGPKTSPSNGGADAEDDAFWTTVEKPYDPDNTTDWKPTTEGEVITGRYTYKNTVSLDDDNNPGSKREGLVYEITKKDFAKFSVWGGFSLDRGMEKVPMNAMVRITYNGKRDIPGGRTVKEFTVQYRQA